LANQTESTGPLTSVIDTSYVIASIVCEYGIKKYGKSDFLKLLQNERETNLVFEKLGLNKENIQGQLLRL